MGENGRSQEKPCDHPQAELGLSHVSELGLNLQRWWWDDERFRTLKISVLNHSATSAATDSLSQSRTFIQDRSKIRQQLLKGVQAKFFKHFCNTWKRWRHMEQPNSTQLTRISYPLYATNPSSSLPKSIGCHEHNHRRGTDVLRIKGTWNWHVKTKKKTRITPISAPSA